jgi:gliding motility-associated-like protein
LKNDYLYLDGLDNNSNTVTIYSRWGDELIRFENYNNNDIRWDGTSNGQLCPQGTYYYVLEIAATNSKLIGWIQIVY